ncbi:MAG TPA: hypothetical protein VD695_01155 [Gaiellaceae bacterium]|nr:hypothetical protein [Gaiellaceae bacterium]HXV95131.1 hypothetical protein [Gaiellaceae bacterium]
MGRTATWLLVGAVVALGVVAGADALLDAGGPEAAPAEPAPAMASTESELALDPEVESETEAVGLAFRAAREALRAAGVPAGVLTFADEQCRLHSVTLPDLEPHPGSRGEACSFGSSVGGEFAEGGPPPYPFGSLAALCRDGRIELRLPNRDLFARARGRCGVVWRPDGTPTFARRGEVLRFAPCPGDEPGALPLRCTRTLLSRADLARELRRAGWDGARFRIGEFHWLGNRRLIATVGLGDGSELLAVFAGRRLVSSPRFAYEGLSGLRPSPRGTFLAARIDSPGGLLVVDRRGRPVPLAMRHGDALAWSPDERWIAEATAGGIFVFRAGDRSPELLHVPIVARDLVWR